MKKLPAISIIMPVYNAERYLHEAIGSVIEQNFNDWELICVNDGSTDESETILNQYAQNDARIIVTSQPHSGNASTGRNKAVALASGQFIAMLDADDKLGHDSLSIIFAKIKETKADFVLYNLCFWNHENNHIIKELRGFHGDVDIVITGPEAFRASLNWQIGGCGAIHRDLIKRIGYCEKGMNGDELSTRLFLLNSQKVAFSEAKYYYRQNPHSTTRSISAKRFFVLDTDYELIKLIDERPQLTDLLPSMVQNYLSSVFYRIVDYHRNKQQLSICDRKEVLAYLSRHYKNISRDKLMNYNSKHYRDIKSRILSIAFGDFKLLYVLTFIAFLVQKAKRSGKSD